MANISLESSIRTCKVDTSWANKLESDRFLNPNMMVCPTWNGHDTAGRPVCFDSFMTKRAGCHSAADRITVENAQRPQYIEYVNLDAGGIRGHCDQRKQINPDTICHKNTLDQVHHQTGQFGHVSGFSQNIFPNCMSCSRNEQNQQCAPVQKKKNNDVVETYLRHKRRNGGRIPRGGRRR
jgi:hypothetical protein